MALLSRMVGELILDHDFVGLPGVGTFVAEMVPATFSDRGYTVNPPYRRLSFSQDVIEDNLLVDFYATENSVDRPTAKAYITAFLAGMKTVLDERKAVTFPGLGRLRATRQNRLFFVPNEDLDIYPEGFALEPLSLKTHVETDEEVSIAVSDLASIIEAARREPETAPAPGGPVPATAAPEVPAAAETPTSASAPAAAKIPEAPSAPESPVPTATAFPEVPAAVTPRGKRRGWIWPVAIAGAAALLLVAFMVLARIAPDFIDTLLYTEEELRIINA